ncbi:MAG TPA: PAS domain S-box protein [Armatimonadota bacterium]|nr:PAS domain S-box protein [Armatimonadota bacterium]
MNDLEPTSPTRHPAPEGDAVAVRHPADTPPELAFLARAVTELSLLPLKADVYRRIGELVREAIGNAVVAVQSYDEADGKLTMRALVGVEGLLDGFLSVMGGHPIGMSFPIHDEARAGLGSGRLIQLSGGIHSLALGVVPRSICHALERLTRLSGTFVIGLCAGSKLVGSVGIIARSKPPVPNSSVIEALARHAALIIHHRQVAAAWQESEARYRLLTEHAADVVWMTDLRLRFTYVSSSVRHLLGYTPGEIMAMPLPQILAPGSLSLVRGILAEEMAREWRTPHDPAYHRVVELEAKRKDGSSLWISVRAEFVRDPEGSPIGILGTTRDVTELRLREEERHLVEARASRCKKVRCLRGMARAIGREIEALPTGPDTPTEPILAYAQTLLGYTSEDKDSREQIDIPSLIEEVLPLIRERVSCSTQLHHARTERLPPVTGHPALLRDALATLAAGLLAAFPAGDTGLQVWSGTRAVDALDLAHFILSESLLPGTHACVEFSVHAPETTTLSADDLFDRLLGNYGTPAIRVANALCILLDHGGALQASLEENGRLSLSLLLPFGLHKREDATEEHPFEAEAPDWSCPSTVLIVDADAGTRWLAQSALEEAGIAALSVDSVAAAVKALRRDTNIAVVLLDSAIAPSGGITAIPELLRARPGVPIVYCSGFGEPAPSETDGIAGLIQKPFLPKVLVRTVRGVLAR